MNLCTYCALLYCTVLYYVLAGMNGLERTVTLQCVRVKGGGAFKNGIAGEEIKCVQQKT